MMMSKSHKSDANAAKRETAKKIRGVVVVIGLAVLLYFAFKKGGKGAEKDDDGKTPHEEGGKDGKSAEVVDLDCE